MYGNVQNANLQTRHAFKHVAYAKNSRIEIRLLWREKVNQKQVILLYIV